SSPRYRPGFFPRSRSSRVLPLSCVFDLTVDVRAHRGRVASAVPLRNTRREAHILRSRWRCGRGSGHLAWRPGGRVPDVSWARERPERSEGRPVSAAGRLVLACLLALPVWTTTSSL